MGRKSVKPRDANRNPMVDRGAIRNSTAGRRDRRRSNVRRGRGKKGSRPESCPRRRLRAAEGQLIKKQHASKDRDNKNQEEYNRWSIGG